MANPLSPQGGPKKGGIKFSLWWMYAIIFLFLAGIFMFDNNTVTKEVSYTKFEQYVEQDHGVTKIIVSSNGKDLSAYLTDSLASRVFANSNYTPGEGVKPKVECVIPSTDQLARKIEQWRASGAFTGEVKYERASEFSSLLWSVLPSALLIGVWIFLMRRMSGGSGGPGGSGGIFNVGKSKAMLFDKNSSNKVTFKDVAGLSEAKTEIEEIL